MCVLVVQSCPTLYDPRDCSPPGSSNYGDSPGKNTGVGSHSLLQGILPTQESNLHLLHCRWILYHLSHQGSAWIVSGKRVIVEDQVLKSVLHTIFKTFHHSTTWLITFLSSAPEQPKLQVLKPFPAYEWLWMRVKESLVTKGVIAINSSTTALYIFIFKRISHEELPSLKSERLLLSL